MAPRSATARAKAVRAAAAEARRQVNLSASLGADLVTASSLGLGNVNNTADTDKPVSTATQTELDDLQSQIDGITGIVLTRFAQTFGNASDVSYDITHNKGTTDIIAQVQNLTGSPAVSDLTITDANTVNVSFDVAPGANAFRLVVI
jgi:hypothetical protein